MFELVVVRCIHYLIWKEKAFQVTSIKEIQIVNLNSSLLDYLVDYFFEAQILTLRYFLHLV